MGWLAVFSGPRAIFRNGKHVVLAGVKQRTHQAELVGKKFKNIAIYLENCSCHISQEVILGKIRFA